MAAAATGNDKVFNLRYILVDAVYASAKHAADIPQGHNVPLSGDDFV
jgi:hypothetical protein